MFEYIDSYSYYINKYKIDNKIHEDDKIYKSLNSNLYITQNKHIQFNIEFWDKWGLYIMKEDEKKPYTFSYIRQSASGQRIITIPRHCKGLNKDDYVRIEKAE